MKTKKLTANALLAKFIKKNFKNDLIVGPDSESFQWAESIAKIIGQHAVVLKKKRYTSRTVRIKLKDPLEFKGKDVVIVDDIISTGNTIIEAVRNIKKLGARQFYCVAVHGVFVEKALEKLRKAKVKVVTTNTIPNSVGRIDVSSMVAQNLRKLK